MALLHINFFSKSLSKITEFYMFLPNDLQPMMVEGNPHYERPTKTLYLLHGFSGNAADWMTGSQAQEMAVKYNLAIVMPQGDNSFYLDAKGTGRAYGTFVGEELVAYVGKTFGLSDRREDLYIGGLSMGGFGAIHTGLKYSETFGHIFALSSALIIYDIKGRKPDVFDGIADFDYYTATFGDLDQVEHTENNPEYLVKQHKEQGLRIPPIYMACGSEDFLLNVNHLFRDFLIKEQVDVTYHESPGIHDWKFWNQYLEPAIEWMLGEGGNDGSDK